MPRSGSARTRATLIGLAAIALWSTLALSTTLTGAVPPFQLTAMTFLVGGAIGLAGILARPERLGNLVQPWPVWLVGIGGLFGYHFFYFTALRNAPPAEAGLIAYLWPLLIVLMSAALPGERLRPSHVFGALTGFAGTAILLSGRGTGFEPQYALGYAAAFVCALTWSTYSILSRRFAGVPSDAVAGFCLATALLAAICHLALEETIWPASAGEWMAVAALGLGPVGLAFYAWDHAVKHGDIGLIGILSYGAPLFSTLILVAAGLAEPSLALAVACVLVTFGAALPAFAQRLGGREPH